MNRSMDNLEQLNDTELRHRLLQYGFPNLPVTDTTRKILIKKLRNHINNERAKLRRDSKFVMRYSSDEESDIDMTKKRDRKHSHVTGTIAAASRSTISNTNILSPASPSMLSRRTAPPLKSKIYVSSLITSNDTDEDSDYCSQKSQKSNLWSNTNSTSTSRYCLPTSLSSSPRALQDSWVQNRYSKSPTYVTSNISTDSQLTSNGHNKSKDSPYLSDFTRRLLSLRGETIRDSVFKSGDNLSRISRPLSSVNPDPAEIVHQQPEPRIDQNISPSTAFANLLNRLDEQYGVKQTLIPCVLLSALVLFFVLVAFMYITISPDLVNTINGKNTIYTVCDTSNLNSVIETPTYTCIEKDSIDGALELLKVIAPELQKRAELHQCVDESTPYILNAREAINLMQHKSHTIDVRKTIKNLHNLEYLIEMNPQWKINHVNANGNIISFDKVIRLRNNQSNYFAIKNARLPLTCSLYNKLESFFFYIGRVGLVMFGLGIILFTYRVFMNYQQSQKDVVVYFIDEIINTLMRTTATNPDRSTVVVNHLRDKLIPLHKRRKLEWAWNEAIKFLEENESRIQFDVAIRSGEEVKLMRWIDTVSPEQIGQRSQVKKWHSPAFDKTNKIANPPTPCLKIRQMFDKFEANNSNLKTIIQDAILEKVGPNCKIYDIQLDKATCCVYVRCASVKDAGIVHNEINGWWFDKRLVSIKFLRLERYLGRFPKSSSGPTCLRPSNTQNLSMSQCSKDYGALNRMDDDIDKDEDDN